MCSLSIVSTRVEVRSTGKISEMYRLLASLHHQTKDFALGKKASLSSGLQVRLVSFVVAAAASEPEANERGSSLISRRLLYRGLQSLFLTKRKELWLCANRRFRMRSGMRKELWLCANGNILGCAVSHVLSCHDYHVFSYILQNLTRVSKRL